MSESILVLISCLAGVALGGGVVWVLTSKQRGPLEQALRDSQEELSLVRAEGNRLATTLATKEEAVRQQEQAAIAERERSAKQEQATQALQAELKAAQETASDQKAKAADLSAQVTGLQESLVALRAELTETRTAQQGTEKALAETRELLATTQEQQAQERKHAEEKLAMLQQAREEMTKEFKALANDVMAQHGETFSKQNKTQVDALLTPLRDKLNEFHTSLQSTHKETATERARLAEQIKHLSETSLRMSDQTENLTKALKGKAQTQGAWGEMVLASILERSGLREGIEYETQISHTTEEQKRLRPDVIVNLPGEQQVIIDSKVSLTAFERYVNGEDEEARSLALAEHVASLKRHINDLGSKEYHAEIGSGLDYVLMFVPIEGALAAAVQQDPELTSFAVSRNVAIATPTTLTIALRTIANVWNIERRNLNAEDIAKKAGALYDKFVGFIADMEKIKKGLDSSTSAYDAAMNKLHTGKGNLINRADVLKKLGAKASKSISEDLRARAGADDDDDDEAGEMALLEPQD